ncbi:hypothetical protein MGMO_45c00430 [Methyloglobulus morosus KoM1]|uniref:Uncharacterized protein n=1 Tax=Methyloglobulus morosus KoM1 TaxID=1116472 RepID=V5DZT2_9GAMM|nr:hypothetical protein MGMO_45c00430 [Methyloglobulus morosus KoM1]
MCSILAQAQLKNIKGRLSALKAQEFYQITFRGRLYGYLETLQKNQDKWLVYLMKGLIKARTVMVER